MCPSRFRIFTRSYCDLGNTNVSSNLRVAVELVNVVADSRYKLYDDFLHADGRRLAEYLGAVRGAVLVGLENGGSDPFKVVLAS